MSIRRPALAFAFIALAFPLGCRDCTPPASQPGSTALVAHRTGMTHNGMPRNGISRDALRAGQPLLDRLAQGPLNDATLGADAASKVLQPSSPLYEDINQLMTYLTSCALDPAQFVSVTEAGTPRRFQGELGLCGPSSPLGSWAAAPPTKACLEAVSSCVLARVNALGKRVVISVRGEPAPLFGLQGTVGVETMFREDHGTAIASFNDCAAAGATGSATQDCGWAPRYVGRCEANDIDGGVQKPVTLTRRSTGPAPYPTFVRICEGLYGCNEEQDQASVKRNYTALLMSDVLQGEGDTVQFDCPHNGPLIDGVQVGYFSVMVAGASREQLDAAGLDLQPAPGGPAGAVTYPASEAEVFTFREGAFYGDLFTKDKHKPCDCDEARGADPRCRAVLSGDQYACFSDSWEDGLAHLADRLCAGPIGVEGQTCFLNTPTSCSRVSTENSGACIEETSGSSPIYAPCKQPGAAPGAAPWAYPITVYLNHPCDLSGAGNTCSSAKPWAPLR